MFKSFIWMFKTPDYKSQLLYLVKMFCLFALMAFCAYFAAYILRYEHVISNVFLFISGLLTLIPVLIFSGYFWELVSAIMDRNIDFSASNIYDGKIKAKDVVEFPELNTKTFLWRGIASIIATMLLVVPHSLIVMMNTYNLESGFINPRLVVPFSMFFSFFIPAQLWCYAKSNSLTEVLNLRKIVHLTGNYFWRYVITVIIYAAMNYFTASLEASLYNNSQTISGVLLIALYWIFKFLYFSFVYAYLIGAITPAGED